MACLARLKGGIARRAAQALGCSEGDVLGAMTRAGRHNGFVLHLPRMKDTEMSAEKLTREIEPRILGAQTGVAKVFAQGPLIHFELAPETLCEAVLTDIEKSPSYGFTSAEANGKSVLVEYSSPNIAKPFHAGHLRSTLLGAYISRLSAAMGNKVTKVNYIGDWGTQFGLLAEGFKQYGSEEQLTEDPLRHLYDVYVKANKNDDHVFKQSAQKTLLALANGNEGAVAQWQRFKDISLACYRTIYEKLGIDFDRIEFESSMVPHTAEIINEMQEKDLLFSEHNGAQVIDFGDEKISNAIIQKQDGTSVYLTRDLACAKRRWEQAHFDEMIYVAGSTQSLHFQQLFQALKLLGCNWAERCEHVGFGNVELMSTRSGTAVFLDDILRETKERMLDKIQESEGREIADPELVADAVALSSIIIQDFKAKRVKGYKFDWNRMLKSEGDTGPFLMYSYARLASIERVTGVQRSTSTAGTRLNEKHAHDMVDVLSRYELTLSESYRKRDPSILVQYLFSLARSVSTSFATLRVKGAQDTDTAEERMRLFWSARVVLGSGMKLLGISPLDRI